MAIDPATAQQASQSADSVMQASGLSGQQQPGYQNIGYNNAGNPQFADSKLLNSTDSSTGPAAAQITGSLLSDMGAFKSPDEQKKFQSISSTATDKQLDSKLTEASQNGDKQGFINTFLGALGKPSTSDINKNVSNNPQGIATALTAGRLFSVWGQLSPAQKSLAISNTGIKNFQFGSGNGLDSEPLVKDGQGNTKMTVGDALGMYSKGINSIPLAQKYSQLGPIQQIASGQDDPNQAGQTAQSLNLLGHGKTGAAVPNITPQSLQSAGFRQAPQFGVGAVLSDSSVAQPPQGFQTVSGNKSGTIAVPAQNADSSQGAVQGSFAGTPGGVSSVSASTNKLYNRWKGGKSPTQGVNGGNALAGGLHQMVKTNPLLAAGVIGHNLHKHTAGSYGRR